MRYYRFVYKHENGLYQYDWDTKEKANSLLAQYKLQRPEDDFWIESMDVCKYPEGKQVL